MSSDFDINLAMSPSLFPNRPVISLARSLRRREPRQGRMRARRVQDGGHAPRAVRAGVSEKLNYGFTNEPSTGKRQRRPGPGSDGSGPCRDRCRAARGGRVPSGLAFPVSAIAVAAKLMGETLDKL